MSAGADVLKRACEALEEMLANSMYSRHFDHAGAMNATQLSERDLFVRQFVAARTALTELRALRVVEGVVDSLGVERDDVIPFYRAPYSHRECRPATLLLPASLKEDET